MRKTILLFALLFAPLCVFAQQGNQSLPSGSGGGISFGIGAGSAQAQTVNPSTAIVSLTTGLQVCWLPIVANTAAAPTLSVSALTAKPITKYGTVALVANDITTVGVACAIYDGTEFQLQNPLAGGVFSGSLSLGSGASSAGATATGGFACVEGASTGWTPTVGQDYQRCDATLHTFVCSINGAVEGTCPSNAVVTNPSATQTITATGASTIALALVSPGSASNYGVTLRDSSTNLIFAIDPETSGATSYYGVGGSNGVVNLGDTTDPAFVRIDRNAGLVTDKGGLKSQYLLCAQGAANGHATANTITDECPTAVTAYENVKPGVAATGVMTNNVAAAVNTQGFSGDANHSAPVTIGSGTSIGPTTLCSSANCPTGTYVVHTYIDITTACGTTGTYVVNLIYTDDQGAKTIPVNLNGTGAVPATGVLTTTSTANFGESSQVIRLTSGNLNYTTTAVACGTAGPMVGKLYMAAVPVM